jgi:uncharacterized protein (DUF58 family)
MILKNIYNFLKPKSSLSFTYEGKGLTVLIIFLGISALTTGNNLLYLVVAMLLSFVIISGVLSEISLRGITVQRSFPKHLFACEKFNTFWQVENKKTVPSFSIKLKEIMERDEKSLDGGKGYFIKVLPGKMVKGSVPYCFKKRGSYKLKGFRLSTHFPFGLFLKSRMVECSREVIVYPPIKSLQTSNIKGKALHDKAIRLIKGRGGNLRNIREYIPGEDSRAIHWKSSAKSSRLLLKEFEKEEGKRVTIVLNNTKGPEKDSRFDDLFEKSVEFTASIVSSLISSGYSVGIQTLQEKIPCREGGESLYRIMNLLAVIEPVKVNPDVSQNSQFSKQSLNRRVERGSSMVFVGPRASDMRGAGNGRGLAFAMDSLTV